MTKQRYARTSSRLGMLIQERARRVVAVRDTSLSWTLECGLLALLGPKQYGYGYVLFFRQSRGLADLAGRQSEAAHFWWKGRYARWLKTKAG